MENHSSPPATVAVEHQDQISDICRACRTHGQFAFDTEFVMEDRYEVELGLIQLATDSLVAVVDPYLQLDLTPIWKLVCDQQVETVVHAGQEDLAICLQQTDTIPQRIYDVQIAAGFAGYDYPLSLQKLVQAVLHVRLHKSKTLTDWRRRPLAASQIHYAAQDVRYLLAVRGKLDEGLARCDRLEWVREECSRFEAKSFYLREEVEKLSRVKGSGALQGRQLVILRKLLAWRETTAEKLNRPIRVVLKDHLLVEIAKHEINSFKEVRDLRGINLSDRHVRSLCAVVDEALQTPSDQWPIPIPRDVESPTETALIALATGVIRSYCIEHSIAYGLVATKKSIRKLIRYCMNESPAQQADIELLAGWRGRTVGTTLLDILRGRRFIRVDSARAGSIVCPPAQDDHPSR